MAEALCHHPQCTIGGRAAPRMSRARAPPLRRQCQVPEQSEEVRERRKHATAENRKSVLVCGQARRRKAQGSKARGLGRYSWGWLCLDGTTRRDGGGWSRMGGDARLRRCGAGGYKRAVRQRNGAYCGYQGNFLCETRTGRTIVGDRRVRGGSRRCL